MDLGSRDAFDRMGTLGIEEEFFIVDADGRPTSGTDELVYENDPPEILDGRLDHELFKFVIETQTPTEDSLDAVGESLIDVRSALVEYANRHGFDIAAAGLHPAAKWRELEHAEKPRYRSQLDRIQYPQHRNTTAGLHVHVGVDDADKAVWIANELRWYLPIMLALSVNSPYWNGFDTGLESARANIFEALPNTGVPTAFQDFDAFQQFEQTMVESGSINDRGELWYDVRPHSTHGTVEVRVPDGQADPNRVLAFVAYTEALVGDLAARYDDGESGHEYRREILDENKWRALRYGHEAEFLSKDCSETIHLGGLVDRERSRLGVSGITDMYDTEGGAAKQRRLWDSEGLEALCQSLLLE